MVKSMRSRIKVGAKVEREHMPTLKWMKRFREKTGKCPPAEQVFEHIAGDHIKERKDYYPRLKKARL